jgi:hypothetical protein
MERERVELTRSIETLKAGPARSLERTKVEMQEQSSQRLDALTRKREVYGAFIASSRVLSQLTKTREEELAFIDAYARSYLWGSEEAVIAIRRLVDCLVNHAKAKGID